MKKLFAIMSLVFFYSMLDVTAQNLFNQDFTPSNNLGDYFSSTSATANQLDYISNLGNAPASVTAGVFSWNKDGSSSPAWMVRNTSFTNNPTFLKFQMKVRFMPPENFASTSSGSSFLCIGDGTSGTWGYKNDNGGAVPTAAESFARVDFLYTVKPEGVTFRAGNSFIQFSGWQDITMFCNRTANPVSYVGPDNVTTTVNGGYSDLWIGTTKVRANVSPFQNQGPSSVDLKKFKIIFPSTLQNMKIEIDYIKVWDESVLPVKLIDFRGMNKNGYNELFWSTASEINNSHFNIYKSSDGKSFNLLTTVNGKGNRNLISNYTYSDRITNASELYYKLEQVDFDGRAEELRTVFLKSSFASVNYYVNVKEDNSVGIFSTSNNLSEVKNVKIYNVSGSKLVDQAVNSADKILIAKKLYNGIYVLQLVLENGKTEVLKFVV